MPIPERSTFSHRATSVLLVVALFLVTPLGNAADVLTSRNNNARTGVNGAEHILAPRSVDAASFGKLWTLYADGQVVAQPLYLSALAVDTSTNPNAPRVQGTFNAVLIATMHNTIYLYEADRERPGPDGRNVPLWATWLGQPRPSGKDIDMWSTNDPEWGVLSTPVIDPTKSIVYVVAWHDDGGPGQNYRYRLHALRLKDGAHLAPPVVLQAPALNAVRQKQRPGLLLDGGIVYVALGGDNNRGLLLAHDATTLAQEAVWTVTPTGQSGGLWQSGAAPAADADGNIYLMTGNGTFDAHKGGSNYGDSFVKLRLEGDTIVVKDFFTPCNERHLNDIDMDLGSSGPVLAADAKLIFGAGKEGRLYLLSTNNLGKHTAPPTPGAITCSNPNALQEFAASPGHVHGSPIFWQRGSEALAYVWGENDRLRAYRFVNRRFAPNPKLGPNRPPPPEGMPGGMLSLSSRGSSDGVVWAVVPLNGDANKQRGVKGVVIAMDAQDVSKVLWTSEQSGARDRLGLFAKYVPPTIANGKVFVATYGNDEPLREYRADRPQAFPTRYQVVVYGPLTDPSVPVVNQSRDDVQLVEATVGGSVSIDVSRCRQATAETLDCTDELSRIAGAPSLEALTVPTGHRFDGCRMARVVTVVKSAAIQNTLGIGFYAADATAGQLSQNHGRLIPSAELKNVGDAVTKSGHAAKLHEFAALVDCELAPGVAARKQFKPYADFAGGPPRATFRNWDPIAGNYALGGSSTRIDRRAEVLR
jgi:hypothetical protein